MSSDIGSIIDNGSWQLIQTLRDGHCLLHATRLSWINQTKTKPPSHEDLKAKVFIETITNSDKYLSFMNHQNRSIMLNECKMYTLYKHYNSAFGDIVPLILANALNIEINIIGWFSKTLTLTPNTRGPTCAKLVIHKYEDHYSGVHFTECQLKPPQTNPMRRSIQYSSEELMTIASQPCSIKRVVRKRLFQLHLWKGHKHQGTNPGQDAQGKTINIRITKRLEKCKSRDQSKGNANNLISVHQGRWDTVLEGIIIMLVKKMQLLPQMWSIPVIHNTYLWRHVLS